MVHGVEENCDCVNIVNVEPITTVLVSSAARAFSIVHCQLSHEVILQLHDAFDCFSIIVGL